MVMIGFPVKIKSALVLCFLVAIASCAFAKPRHPNVDSLSKNSREIFLTSMKWGDQYFDPQEGLCRSAGFPTSGTSRIGNYYAVRDSTWYAIGLLLRDQPGDRDRAAQILRAVLKA